MQDMWNNLAANLKDQKMKGLQEKLTDTQMKAEDMRVYEK